MQGCWFLTFYDTVRRMQGFTFSQVFGFPPTKEVKKVKKNDLSVRKWQLSLTLLYFSYALLQRDIHSMASSSCSWCSCVKLPANCVTGHLCSRCSIVCGCWPQWLQVGVFLFPHLCRVWEFMPLTSLMSEAFWAYVIATAATWRNIKAACSGHFWVGSLK